MRTPGARCIKGARCTSSEFCGGQNVAVSGAAVRGPAGPNDLAGLQGEIGKCDRRQKLAEAVAPRDAMAGGGWLGAGFDPIVREIDEPYLADAGPGVGGRFGAAVVVDGRIGDLHQQQHVRRFGVFEGIVVVATSSIRSSWNSERWETASGFCTRTIGPAEKALVSRSTRGAWRLPIRGHDDHLALQKLDTVARGEDAGPPNGVKSSRVKLLRGRDAGGGIATVTCIVPRGLRAAAVARDLPKARRQCRDEGRHVVRRSRSATMTIDRG